MAFVLYRSRPSPERTGGSGMLWRLGSHRVFSVAPNAEVAHLEEIAGNGSALYRKHEYICSMSELLMFRRTILIGWSRCFPVLISAFSSLPWIHTISSYPNWSAMR